MKFTLAYDGVLHSQNARDIFEKKWEIRQYLAPQITELWRVHPCLTQLASYLPRTAYGWHESHHSVVDAATISPPKTPNDIDLQAPIDVGGIMFSPLVRDSYALACSLRVLFMRNEPVGKVYQGGDLDNRIKVFIDALKVPKSEIDRVRQVYPKPTEPIQCLLEDDGLITGLSIESRRLLSMPNTPANYVRLLVDVDISVTLPRFYNYSFLGD